MTKGNLIRRVFTKTIQDEGQVLTCEGVVGLPAKIVGESHAGNKVVDIREVEEKRLSYNLHGTLTININRTGEEVGTIGYSLRAESLSKNQTDSNNAALILTKSGYEEIK